MARLTLVWGPRMVNPALPQSTRLIKKALCICLPNNTNEMTMTHVMCVMQVVGGESEGSGQQCEQRGLHKAGASG